LCIICGLLALALGILADKFYQAGLLNRKGLEAVLP